MTPSADDRLYLVLDVGTTNIKALVFGANLKEIYSEERQVETTHPEVDWDEQDPAEILRVCKDLIASAEPHAPGGSLLGITNQRESVLAWDKSSGQPLTPMLLWSDKRTEGYCRELKSEGVEDVIRRKTGLLLTPYSSAPKIHWILQQGSVINCKDVAVGTLDSWLVFNLTGQFLTDYTNASRTMLFNIKTKQWDDDLLELFKVSKSCLAEVVDSQSDFGSYATASTHMAHSVRAVIGDQQASMYAAGNKVGTTKVTYGTGIFPMKITGSEFVRQDGYLTTLAIGGAGQPVYALEGKVENAAPRVSKVYGVDKPAFDQLMLDLAHEAAPVIAGLVDHPGQLVYVDGGISQNDDILAEQERLNHIKTERLPSHNGTALGVAKLLRDHASRPIPSLAI